jgi:hypothetical protein
MISQLIDADLNFYCLCHGNVLNPRLVVAGSS